MDLSLAEENVCKKEYFSGSIWDRNDLTYGIASYSNRLEPSAVDEVMKQAFAIWEKHANLRFTVTSGEEVRSSVMIQKTYDNN